MKLSRISFAQHVGRHFKKHWQIQGLKKVQKSPVFELLEKNNVPIYNPEDIYKEPRPYIEYEVVGFKPKPIQFDNTHTNWHDEILFTYKDNNVLLEGLRQAQVLTNTVIIKDGLPDNYQPEEHNKDFDRKVQNAILTAHVFDSEQEKLPKRKDPARPAWNFPRDYGITADRKNKLTTSKLLQLLEVNEKSDLVRGRFLLNEVFFSFPFEKDDSKIQSQLTVDTLITAGKALGPITNESTQHVSVPDLKPLTCTITMNEENIYKLQNIYPIGKNTDKRHPHTLVVHYDKTVVGNIFEEEVVENQILGRSLMETFTVAATYARQEFGENVTALPKPVTVQCIHTDGRLFHFGVLQLNTLDLNNINIKNIWYHIPERLPLFEICEYKRGEPILKGYNSEVVQYLSSFYRKN